ncbi:MAG: hypothetical protein A2017_15305 [Lentisphaerae bacterium GWF2_44_16]|nr:MAG: hypothetical protein A2017_15305 [Lentisphaerae bacterium GWF2_44_16]
MGTGDFFYAASQQHIKLAADLGIKNVVIDSRGHGKDRIDGASDDQLCLMPGYRKVYNIRKKFEAAIEKERDTIRRKIKLAENLGLTPFLHSYEISIPVEIRKAYPSLFVKQTRESIKCDPACDVDRYMCLSDPAIRALVSDKIEEVLSSFSGIGGYIYSFHESQLTTFSHFCDKCKKEERFKLVKWLYDAVTEGASRVNRKLVIIPRLWGITHPREMGYQNLKDIAEIIDYDQSHWFCRRIPAIKKYHYDPETVNPKLGGMVEEDGNMLMYKATWGDYTLFQPLNKWAASYGKARQIVELSLEHCVAGRNIPLIISAQHQDIIKRLRKDKVSFCAVPVNWGRVYRDTDAHKEGADAKHWGLNFLNIELLGKLLKNPAISLTKEISLILSAKYKEKVSEKISSSLLKTAEIMAAAVNIRGVSSVMNLDYVLSKPTYTFRLTLSCAYWYKVMRENGDSLISTDDENMEKIFKEKDNAVIMAEKLLKDILTDLKKLKSDALKKELSQFFCDFTDIIEYLAVSRKRLWIMLKIQKEKKVSFTWTKKLDELLDNEKNIQARSEIVNKIYNGAFDKLF